MSYSDFVSGTRRTWPYGTRLAVKVIGLDPGVCICMDENREGFVLIGGTGDERTAQVGDLGTIQFHNGGPLGGYWVLTLAPKAEATA